MYCRTVSAPTGASRGGEKLPALRLEPPDAGEKPGSARNEAAKTAGRTGPAARPATRKTAQDDFPEGTYVQVSTIEDLFAILSDRPVRAILELNRNTIPALLGLANADLPGGSPVLPFSKRELILSIDPYLPQGIEDGLSTTLDDLIENGYSHFIVNNPGHVGMLRNRGLKLIAGPYLYTFNRWAVDWLNKQGLCNLVTPLENSRDNLEATIDQDYRSNVLVTLFAYPALFRMRFKLPDDYEFTFFSDRQGGVFKALSTEDGSFVLPESPFSITDKSAVLRKEGFCRFLIDLSKTKVVKQEYRLIMDSYRKGTPLPDVSRFNWKDGFYDPDKIEEQKQMTERANFRKVNRKPGEAGEKKTAPRSGVSRTGGRKPAPRGPRKSSR